MFSQIYATDDVLAHSYLFWIAAQVVAILILVYLFLRWRPGFTGGKTVGETINALLEARANQIETQLEAAQQSREEAAKIHEQSRVEIETARRESEVIVSRAEETSKAIQKEIQERAREEYTRIVGQARVQIEYERERAEAALRREAADIVVDAAGQVIRRHLDPQTDRRLIVSSLDDLKEVR